MNSERKYNAAHTMDLFFFFFPQTRLRGKSEKAKTALPERKHRKTSEGIIGDLLLWISFFLKQRTTPRRAVALQQSWMEKAETVFTVTDCHCDVKTTRNPQCGWSDMHPLQNYLPVS
jgi:hypothetical protein